MAIGVAIMFVFTLWVSVLLFKNEGFTNLVTEPNEQSNEATFEQSNEATFQQAAASVPLPPIEVSLSSTNNGILISWKQTCPLCEDVVRVYRRQPPTGQWIILTTTSQTTYIDTNLSSGVQYQYRVSTVSRYGVESDFSDIQSYQW